MHEEEANTARFPLPLRNALAELTIAGLGDEMAAMALAWLADPDLALPAVAAARLAAVHLIDDPSRPALLAVHAPHAADTRAHAKRALLARDVFARLGGRASDDVGQAVRCAVALWNEELFFEVHEVLEAVWKTRAGDVRQALQGLIQIAVAYHHLGHGNLRGARTLLAEGRERLAAVPATTLAGADVVGLLEETVPWLERLARNDAPAGPPPRLRASEMG